MLKRKATVPPEFNRGTGDTVDRYGYYYPACCRSEGASPEVIGKVLDVGTHFPLCPKHNRPTMWRLYLSAQETPSAT